MKIALLGDISLNGRYDLENDSRAISRVEAVREIVSDCDYVIGNLESPLTKRTKTFTCKGVYLRSAPQSVRVLKTLGITHVTLANNHVFDYGLQGALETIDILNREDIQYVGLNNKPCLLKKDDDKALLDGFCCYSANGIGYGKSLNQVRQLDYGKIKSFLELAKQKDALPIASVHFGIEEVHYPSVEHRKLFRTLARDYNYILHGNHPHAIQGYELVNNSQMYYALGDLCFDTATETSINRSAIQTDESRESYIVKLFVEGNKCISTEIITVTDLPDGIIRKNSDIMEKLKKYSRDLQLDDSSLLELRKRELRKNAQSAQKRDWRFFVDRLNYKYVGAYLNGILHQNKYKEIMKLFLDEERE